MFWFPDLQQGFLIMKKKHFIELNSIRKFFVFCLEFLFYQKNNNKMNKFNQNRTHNTIPIYKRVRYVYNKYTGRSFRRAKLYTIFYKYVE